MTRFVDSAIRLRSYVDAIECRVNDELGTTIVRQDLIISAHALTEAALLIQELQREGKE